MWVRVATFEGGDTEKLDKLMDERMSSGEMAPPEGMSSVLILDDKDAKKRLRDIGDMHLELEEALANPARARDSRSSISASRPQQRLALWVAVALLGGLAGGMVLWRMNRTADLPAQTPARFTIQLPPGEPLGSPGERLTPAGAPPAGPRPRAPVRVAAAAGR